MSYHELHDSVELWHGKCELIDNQQHQLMFLQTETSQRLLFLFALSIAWCKHDSNNKFNDTFVGHFRRGAGVFFDQESGYKALDAFLRHTGSTRSNTRVLFRKYATGQHQP